MSTLADSIRFKAIDYGYWSLESESQRRGMRKDIAVVLGCETRAVTDALKRSGRVGRPRNPALARCESCGQALPHAAAED
jgi:hypothetical protein